MEKQKELLINDLQSIKDQMNEMYTDYFSKIKPKYSSGITDILRMKDLTNAEKIIVLHFIELEKQGIDPVNIGTMCQQIGKCRAAYGKLVRTLCDKGYLKAHHRRGYYQLNKVF